MKKSLNINVNKDDQNINDFLFCWSEFSERPNKISIYNSFETTTFLQIINKYGAKDSTSQSEIYPAPIEFLENVKYLTKINDNIQISYVIYDKRSDESFIGDVSVYFSTKSEDIVKSLIEEIESSMEIEETENEEHNFYTLTLDNSGFDILPINFLQTDFENIDLYYNDGVLKSTKKLVRKINETQKGISIIYGEKGVGKSSLISYLSQTIEKKIIFIPSTLVETAINSFDFRSFLLKHKNSLIIIDDFESLTTDLYLKTNNSIKNLLQLVDGLDSDNFSINILLSLNISNLEELDENLLESNNLLDVIFIDHLGIDKIKDLLELHKIKRKIKVESKLVDVLKKKNKYEKTKSIGFE